MLDNAETSLDRGDLSTAMNYMLAAIHLTLAEVEEKK